MGPWDQSPSDVLRRYGTPLGGTLEFVVDFGDEQLKIARASATPATNVSATPGRLSVCQ